MPLTKQIIEKVVSKTVKSALTDTNTRLDQLETKMDKKFTEIGKKIDNLNSTVINFAGQVKTFDEEQTFLSHRSSVHSKQIERLQKKVFGAVQMA